MLKLPKGLKKKKKDKKSKKNQELFTEEELAAYKLREKQGAAEVVEHTSASGSSASAANVNPSAPQTVVTSTPAQAGDEDEWSKFNALTTGVDSILKKTQGNLDRIKESSFFQRVAPKPEPTKTPVQHHAEPAEPIVDETVQSLESSAPKQSEEERFLANAVVELSESEEESEEGEDIFDTAYIDTLAKANVELYVPESPEEEFDTGPDPFDTAYAEKVINGPEVSKRGKKLVNIGAAVEVLTGRVEKVAQSSGSRRPRRGIQNLLLGSFDEGTAGGGAEAGLTAEEVVVQSLLDAIPDDILGGPIDLTGSLHINYLKEQREKAAVEEERQLELQLENDTNANNEDIDDEFNELAAEGLTKQVHVLSEAIVYDHTSTERPTKSDSLFATAAPPPRPAPPTRPPPPRTTAQVVPTDSDLSDEIGDDPFDTTFAEKILPATLLEDDDFDPRKDEEAGETLVISSVQATTIDLLYEPNEELQKLAPHDIVQPDVYQTEDDSDPFNTSAIDCIVQPKAIELSLLEKELLNDDFDFDPRAEEPSSEIHKLNLNRRKSSLSLNIASACLPVKSVGFSTDFLGANIAGGGVKSQKPLTPYYSQTHIEETDKETEDPFDTSFVPSANPSQIELNILEKDLLDGHLLHRSISDPDFDPRAVTPIVGSTAGKADLLDAHELHDIKVLTPALNKSQDFAAGSLDSYVDPFDTSSIEKNILPGRAELKIIEDELLPSVVTEFTARVTVLDSCSDSQELGLGDKVLTPQVQFSTELSLEESDPFDTSIANNLAPGKAEIKQLESELIHQ